MNHSLEQWKISCQCRRIFAPPLSFKMLIICCLQGGWLGARAQLGSCYTSFSPPLTPGGAEGPLSNLGNSLTSLATWSVIDSLFPWVCPPASLYLPESNHCLGSWFPLKQNIFFSFPPPQQYHFPDPAPCLIPQTSGLVQWKLWAGLDVSGQWPPLSKEATSWARP